MVETKDIWLLPVLETACLLLLLRSTVKSIIIILTERFADDNLSGDNLDVRAKHINVSIVILSKRWVQYCILCWSFSFFGQWKMKSKRWKILVIQYKPVLSSETHKLQFVTRMNVWSIFTRISIFPSISNSYFLNYRCCRLRHMNVNWCHERRMDGRLWPKWMEEDTRKYSRSSEATEQRSISQQHSSTLLPLLPFSEWLTDWRTGGGHHLLRPAIVSFLLQNQGT